MQNPKISIQNGSLIHPPGFYITGLMSLPHANIYVIFLSLVYVITVMFNCFIICIILIDHNLHVPKFLAVGNLALVDLVLSTAIIPVMIKIYLHKDNFMEFKLCFVQMFVYYAFLTLESYSLSVLAYDRLIAICFPLKQNAINSTSTMTAILVVMWTFCLSSATVSTSVMTYLSFCNSVYVNSYFCDYAPVFRLSCNDNTLQWTLATVLSLSGLFGPLSFIVLSYTCILIAVFQMKNVDTRLKALATCTEHLILVGIFYIPILTIFILGFFQQGINSHLRIVGLSLSSCIPPCANPIIYSLKTKEVKSRAFVLFKRTFAVDRYHFNSHHKNMK